MDRDLAGICELVRTRSALGQVFIFICLPVAGQYIEVGDKLNEVRAAIAERQDEFEARSKQSETVTINIALRAKAGAQVSGLHWRQLHQLKITAQEELDSIGYHVSSMAAFVGACTALPASRFSVPFKPVLANPVRFPEWNSRCCSAKIRHSC